MASLDFLPSSIGSGGLQPRKSLIKVRLINEQMTNAYMMMFPVARCDKRHTLYAGCYGEAGAIQHRQRRALDVPEKRLSLH